MTLPGHGSTFQRLPHRQRGGGGGGWLSWPSVRLLGCVMDMGCAQGIPFVGHYRTLL